MPDRFRTAIHWFRRDLRLTDNTALLAAVRSAETVAPVFVLSDWRDSHGWTGPKRQHFLCGCLDSLARNLDAIGGRLIIRRGEAPAELEKLIRQARADALFFNRDPDPFGRETERRVAELCASLGVAVRSFKDVVLHEPGEVLTGGGDPYRVYTPYAKNWFSRPKDKPAARPRAIRSPDGLDSLAPPALQTWNLSPDSAANPPEAGERAARGRLQRALAGPVRVYAEKRDFPAVDGTSRLGADLRFGTLSIREVFRRAAEAAAAAETDTERASIHTFQKQLAWREFFMTILHHWPNVLDEEFAPQWRGLPWDDPESGGGKFERWRRGLTGFPLVDAGMRELRETGHMHNRVRMIAAMFLTKDLHLHWRLGEAHFMRHLLDGEIANNNGGWQWSAGTGADAAPYFRIQNPWTQTARYDPDGEYIRRWVPELAGIRDPKRFQTPPADDRPIADDYPLPLVDHRAERGRTLAIFKRHATQQG
ncbi:MAG: deoxyribodipyrimidine photo-lyase [Verrucomicrobiae bacterium]|nr:deoxyribodipyrimidine photo-lyase [Verrucomicrobiae bacterium]